VWHDRKIGAGTEWKGQIDAHLESAELILLLVSPDFLASDYCYDVELKRALKRHEAGTARVIPIILRPVDWHSAPFGKLQALPTDGREISTWRVRDQAYKDVVEGIRRAVRELRASKPDPVKAAVTELLQVKHGASEHPARPWLDPVGGPELRLPMRAEVIPYTETPGNQNERGDGRIVDFRVSSLGQYDATVEWRTNASMEVRVFLFEGSSKIPQRPPVSVQSLGRPGPDSGVHTFTFHELQPGTVYRAVAESDDDHQKLDFKTHEAISAEDVNGH
jgi:TIR domain